MFETEDLLPELADGETGGHDELVITERNTHLRSIPVAGDVGFTEDHSSNGIQQASVYEYNDEENQLHPTAIADSDEEIGVSATSTASSAPRSTEDDDDDDEEARMCSVEEERSRRHRTNPSFYQDHRPDPNEAFKECDFTCHQSVNTWYPPYKKRGTFNCPYSLISAATSRARQREIVHEWRLLHSGTQRAKLEEIYARQLLEREQQTRASQMAAAAAAAASAEPAHIYNTRHRPAAVSNNSNGGGGEPVQQSRRRNNCESTTARPTVSSYL
jgi:hypothetical protein